MSFRHNSKDFSELHNIEEGTSSEENGFSNEDASDGNKPKRFSWRDSIYPEQSIRRVSFSPNLHIFHSSRSLGERSNKTLEYSVSQTFVEQSDQSLCLDSILKS